jgi:hypothetical protein
VQFDTPAFSVAALPFRRLAGGDFEAGHIGFDMREQILNGLDSSTRRSGFERVAALRLRHLLGIG